MRMVRVHEERLASRQEEVAALKEHLSEVEGQKQHLEDERRVFTHAVYSKFVRESVGLQTGSKHHARPGGGGEREGRDARRGTPPRRHPCGCQLARVVVVGSCIA